MPSSAPGCVLTAFPRQMVSFNRPCRPHLKPAVEPAVQAGGLAAAEGSRKPPVWPPALVAFVRLFNERRYWHAHEALEEAWRENKSRFYQGLIIYASAFVHAQRGNPRGVVLQLQKVPRYLQGYPPAYLGLDVEGILRHAGELIDAVQQAGMPEGEALGRLVTWPTLQLDAGRRRGDEAELRPPAGSEG